MSKITPCLWFDGNAEEAANFYVTLLPDSRIDNVVHAPADNPSTPAGAVLLVKFTLAGQHFLGLNGGPKFKFTEAVSFTIDCEDQAEPSIEWFQVPGVDYPSLAGSSTVITDVLVQVSLYHPYAFDTLCGMHGHKHISFAYTPEDHKCIQDSINF